MSVSGWGIKSINNKYKHYLSIMRKRGFGLQVTVHISQHFHRSELMEEVDNKTEEQQLEVDSWISRQPRGM